MNFTRVVNCHHDPYDVWVGRPSIWGNPYHEGRDGDRTTVIAKYQAWFLAHLRDPRFHLATVQLRGKVLGCACAPKPCHAMVIAAWLNGELT